MTLNSVLKASATARLQINLWSDKDIWDSELIETIRYDCGKTDTPELIKCIKWTKQHRKAQVKFISAQKEGFLEIDIYEKENNNEKNN